MEDYLDNKVNILLDSYKNKINKIVESLIEHISFKLNIFESDVEALENKTHTLKSRLKETSAMEREALAITDTELQNTLNNFQKDLIEFRDNNTKAIRSKLNRVYEENKYINSKELIKLLNAQLEWEIEESCSKWNEMQENIIRDSYREITNKFILNLNKLLEEVNSIAFELFNTRISYDIDELELIKKDTFYFKFSTWKPPLFTPSSKDFWILLPKKIRNKKIFLDILSKVENEIIKNGNNLKWDYSSKINDSKYIFKRVLEQYVNFIYDELFQVIEKTLEIKQKKGKTIETEIKIHRESRDKIQNIQDELDEKNLNIIKK